MHPFLPDAINIKTMYHTFQYWKQIHSILSYKQGIIKNVCTCRLPGSLSHQIHVESSHLSDTQHSTGTSHSTQATHITHPHHSPVRAILHVSRVPLLSHFSVIVQHILHYITQLSSHQIRINSLYIMLILLFDEEHYLKSVLEQDNKLIF